MAKRDGSKNLISLADRTPEDRARITKMGNIAHSKAAAKRRTLREWAKAIGSEKICMEDGSKIERDAIVIMQQYISAMNGDVKAARFLAQILGELQDMSNGNPTVQVTGETIELKIE